MGFVCVCRGSSNINFTFLLPDLKGLRLMSSVVHPWNTSLDVFDAWNGKKMQICFKVVLYYPLVIMCDPLHFLSLGTLVLMCQLFRIMEKWFVWNLCRVHIWTFFEPEKLHAAINVCKLDSGRICNAMIKNNFDASLLVLSWLVGCSGLVLILIKSCKY